LLLQPVVKAAVQALKLFYISQHDDGAVGGSSNKRQKVSPVLLLLLLPVRLAVFALTITSLCAS
jgi:hypothetical protein